MKYFLNITIIAAGSVTPFLALAGGSSGGEGEYYHHGMMGGWGGMVLGPIMMIAMIALVIIVVVMILRWMGVIRPDKAEGTSPSGESAMDILNKRFANGEIDKQEFEEKRDVLNN